MIREYCKEYGIKNKEKNQILKEFGSIENFRKAYIEYANGDIKYAK